MGTTGCVGRVASLTSRRSCTNLYVPSAFLTGSIGVLQGECVRTRICWLSSRVIIGFKPCRWRERELGAVWETSGIFELDENWWVVSSYDRGGSVPHLRVYRNREDGGWGRHRRSLCTCTKHEQQVMRGLKGSG